MLKSTFAIHSHVGPRDLLTRGPVHRLDVKWSKWGDVLCGGTIRARGQDSPHRSHSELPVTDALNRSIGAEDGL